MPKARTTPLRSRIYVQYIAVECVQFGVLPLLAARSTQDYSVLLTQLKGWEWLLLGWLLLPAQLFLYNQPRHPVCNLPCQSNRTPLTFPPLWRLLVPASKYPHASIKSAHPVENRSCVCLSQPGALRGGQLRVQVGPHPKRATLRALRSYCKKRSAACCYRNY